jgi:hypothetical protein
MTSGEMSKGFRQQLEQPTPDEAVVRRAQRFERRIVAIERQAGQQGRPARSTFVRASMPLTDSGRLTMPRMISPRARPREGGERQIEQHVELSGVNRLIDRSFEQRSERPASRPICTMRRGSGFPPNPVRPLAID